MSGEHAPLQPSSASRWVQCAASVGLEGLYPDKDAEAAAEGELGHAVVASLVKHGEVTGIAADVITDEMIEGADLIFDHVQEVRAQRHQHATLHVEERVDCSDIHPQCWGTPDVRLLDVGANVLDVWDYKFGHKHVEVVENWQLLAYAIGALKNYGTATRDSIRINLHIVQPRDFHPDGPIRTWSIFGSELFSKYLPVLQVAAAEAMGARPTARTGSECTYCRARHACTTLQTAAFEALTIAGRAHPHDWEPDAQGRELALLQSAREVLNARISGLENELLGHIRFGRPVVGWMAKQGEGRQKWNKPIEEVLALGEMLNIDITKKGAITPKQAIKAGIPAAVVNTYSEVPVGELKLVRDDTRLARRAFGG